MMCVISVHNRMLSGGCLCMGVVVCTISMCGIVSLKGYLSMITA